MTERTLKELTAQRNAEWAKVATKQDLECFADTLTLRLTRMFAVFGIGPIRDVKFIQ